MTDVTNTPDELEAAWEKRLEEIAAENEAKASLPAVPEPAQPKFATVEEWAEAMVKQLQAAPVE